MKRTDFTKQKDNPIAFIDTGSTLLNLACSDRVDGGFPIGKMVNLIGDSSSGKTFVALTSMACVAHNPCMEDWLLKYDDSEQADSFNKELLFGKKAASKIKEPSRMIVKKKGSKPKEVVGSSVLFEDMESALECELDRGVPIYFVEDSFDALSDKAEQKHTKDRLKAHNSGTETTGTYGMSKAKNASTFFRQVVGKIRKTGSFLLIVSQTRADINPRSRATKNRSGGKALKFYASLEIWMVDSKKITRTVSGITEKIGMISTIKVTKNKITGKYREVDIPIYYSYGIDDIGSCIDYLIKMKTWKCPKGGQTITVPQWKVKGKALALSRKKLITYIETKEGKIDSMKALVQKTWDTFEESLKEDRNPRFK